MAIDECEDNQVPKSPIGNVFLSLFSPRSENIISCAMSFRDPIDVEALKNDISNSIIIKHPRFCSLRIRDHHNNGRQHWKTTHVNVDDHIIVHHHNQTSITSKVGVDDHDHDHDHDDEIESAINSFLAEISVSTPLSEKKPLWEVHVLLGLKCIVLRVHHSLGDGASLISMLSACFAKNNNNNVTTSHDANVAVNGDYSVTKNNHNNTKNFTKNTNNKGDYGKEKKGLWLLVKSLWFTIVYLSRVLGRILWVKDQKSVFSAGDGVELWPRKMISAKFLLEDFKSIKLVIPQATINDVLLGVIAAGLSKYRNVKSHSALKQTHQLTAVNPVNLRKHPFIQGIPDLMTIDSNRLSGWGNKSGTVLVPICLSDSLHPIDHVRAMKATMDRKKLSKEACFVHKFLAYVLPTKVGSWCFKRLLTNTTLIISNIKGPLEEIVIADNPVTHMGMNVSSVSQAISIYMVSYAGKAYLQMLVAKDIIPDPEFLLSCFQESFLQIKNSIKTN